MHPRTKVVIWYVDEFDRTWEFSSRWLDFKTDAMEILEKYNDMCYIFYYTIGETTKELDYYNLDELWTSTTRLDTPSKT